MNTAELNGKKYAVTVEGSRLILDEINPEVKGLWRPERDRPYFFVWSTGKVSSDIFDSRDDENRISFGSIFQTEDAAQKAIPLMARANKIIAAALQADPDAGVQSPERAFSVARRLVGEWYAESWNNHYDYGFACCVHSREQAEEMARILNEEGVK